MIRFVLLCASIFAPLFAFNGAAVATQATSFVSATGSDANACTPTSPCATLGFAYTQTIPGGTIMCLNSSQYGVPFTITTSITIDCGTGNVGLMEVNVANNSAAFTINAGAAINVTLRHLSINGIGTDTHGQTTGGIITTAFPGGTLTIEDCVITGFNGGGGSLEGYGIFFSATGSGRSTLSVSNTRIEGNKTGVVVAPVSGQISSVLFNNVAITGSILDGLDLQGAGVIAGVMRESVVANNGANGVVASATNGVFFTVEQSTVSANLSSGIEANSAGADLTVTGSTIGANGTGVKPAAGSIVSFGNNSLNGNAVDGSFTSTMSLR